MGLRDAVRGMSVAWLSFNLATSAVALAGYALGEAAGAPWLLLLAHLLALVNTPVYLVVAGAYAARAVMLGRGFLRELGDPVRGPFIATASIATMLLALDWGVVLGDPRAAAVFFYAGVAVHTFIFAAITLSFLLHEGIEIHAMNPGWYMPATGNVLIPYVGGLLADRGVPVPHSLLGIYLGAGVVFWLALFTIWLYRSIFHHPPPARLIATTWINLTPPSIAPMAYEAVLGMLPGRFTAAAAALRGVSPSLERLLTAFFDMFYYTFWGLATMMLLIVALLTLEYARRGMIEFAESWWALVFPPAAYTVSTIHLYLHHPSETWLLHYAAALYAATLALYVAVTALSAYYGYEEMVKHRRADQLPAPARPLPREIIEEEEEPGQPPHPP